jgi:hypothetical protein
LQNIMSFGTTILDREIESWEDFASMLQEK